MKEKGNDFQQDRNTKRRDLQALVGRARGNSPLFDPARHPAKTDIARPNIPLD
jgi:hypothetical protein